MVILFVYKILWIFYFFWFNGFINWFKFFDEWFVKFIDFISGSSIGGSVFVIFSGGSWSGGRFFFNIEIWIVVVGERLVVLVVVVGIVLGVVDVVVDLFWVVVVFRLVVVVWSN